MFKKIKEKVLDFIDVRNREKFLKTYESGVYTDRHGQQWVNFDARTTGTKF